MNDCFSLDNAFRGRYLGGGILGGGRLYCLSGHKPSKHRTLSPLVKPILHPRLP